MTSLKHNNLIRLHHFMRPQSKETFEDIYLVMDLYDTDLNRIIRSRQKLTDEHLQYFMIQAFRGLHYLHSAKVMHRDLKPSNLLVNADCALAICDFGLARDDQVMSSSDLTQYVVTRWYRPPEVLGMGSNQYTSAVDVWSLGLIFAELMLGRTLLPGTDYIGQLVMIVNLLGSPSIDDMDVVNLFTSAKGRTMLPGDVVEVLVTNSRGTQDADDVERLCKALRLDPYAWCELHRSPFVPEDNFPPWLPLQKPLTLGQLLSAYVDISSSSYLLHQSFFESLFRIYSDSKPSSASSTSTTPSPDPEKVRLLEACASSETGPQLLRSLSKSSTPLCYPSLVDVLEVFSFVQIPLDRLLEVSGPLQTRRYSLANWIPATLPPSPLQLCMREVCARRSANLPAATAVGADAQRVADMLNRAAQDASRDHSDFFFGHTSHPLCCAARSMTRSAAAAGQRGMYVSFSLFGNSLFARQLQAGCTALCNPAQAKSLCSQLFLIGCGTGIAPLIAAVTQLMLRRASTAAGSAPFPCWVFYGARTKAELLYDETLQEALRTGAIAKYEYALSREEDNKKQGRYVTDLVKRNRLMVTDSLQNEGQLFVCGPAKALLSVRQLVKCDLLAEPDDDDSVQEQRLLMLEDRGRLNFDIWSTGNIFE
ncbi:Protein kinase domain family protein [Leishmania donovani]|uniref:Protein kinase domain family protein n=1 Tax=Leishmania donovani TaxID=5661 RepID=A0A504XQX3_LEIDO|nr:Protein kinase domain family protein [Leishmania donovani]TPP50923.1 Protein kinase domain family protein [Leishmania donovani]